VYCLALKTYSVFSSTLIISTNEGQFFVCLSVFAFFGFRFVRSEQIERLYTTAHCSSSWMWRYFSAHCSSPQMNGKKNCVCGSDRPNVRFGRSVRPNFYCAVRHKWQNFFLQDTELFFCITFNANCILSYFRFA
jgi:hypothetical protein